MCGGPRFIAPLCYPSAARGRSRKLPLADASGSVASVAYRAVASVAYRAATVRERFLPQASGPPGSSPGAGSPELRTSTAARRLYQQGEKLGLCLPAAIFAGSRGDRLAMQGPRTAIAITPDLDAV